MNHKKDGKSLDLPATAHLKVKGSILLFNDFNPHGILALL